MTDNCIHCGLCTKNCAFLQKYGMDLSSFADHPELAYHCFLCGQCSRVCPSGIDGKAISLAMRRKRTNDANGALTESGYTALLIEKQKYLFKNYRRTAGKTVLFPGCNFPSFFPRTTDALIRLLQKEGIGIIFDCCGKPIGELGLEQKENETAAALQKRLSDAGVERLVVLCPNCYHYLKKHISTEIVSIYEILCERNMGTTIPGTVPLFLPCPDREERILLEELRHFVPHATPIDNISCCGLGGCAAGKEPDISASFSRKICEENLSDVFTYCASCAGQLRRGGVEGATHILTEILGTHEKPVLSPLKSLWNRAKRVL